ncbi:Auxin-responsive protein SAUR15 [Bienertia sinuspersici]
MAIRLPFVLSNTKQLRTKNQQAVTKGHIPVYLGEQANKMTRYVVPLSYLSYPVFQDLLQCAEEEFGFNHSMGALTIPCSEELFFDLISEFKC